MPPSPDGEGTRLRQVLAALAEVRVVPQAAAALDAALPGVGDSLRQAVLSEVPAYSASANPAVLPGLEAQGRDHVHEIRRLFSGGEVGDFGFVREQARLRAEQRFPLEAMLHAYRCGHRVLSHWMREAAVAALPASPDQAVSAVADFAIEYTNTISTIATSAYVAHARLLAEAEGDRRTGLMNLLLTGHDESDGRVARLLKQAGYLDQRLSFCVAAAQPAIAAEMENPARAQRIAGALLDVVAGTSVRALAGTRGDLVTAVFSDRRRLSGWTAPQADLSERLQSLLLGLGPAVLVGLSADHPSTSYIPRALAEAKVALDFAGPARRVVSFPGLPLRALLVHRGADEVRGAAPAWASALVAADAKAGHALVQTLRALAEADMNVQEAARLLGRHPNTVYARIERIRGITGLDPGRYHDLTELLLAADCWRL